MKKITLSSLLILFLAMIINAQEVDKTQLSIDIQARYNQNFSELAKYTWQREVQVEINNMLKYTSTNAVSIGPDGKLIVQQIDEKSQFKQDGENTTEEEDLRVYVESALKLVSEYVFMNKQQMIDLFNKGTVSEINDTYQVQAFGFVVEDDNLNFLYKKNTLDCVSQTINTRMNGDDVMAVVEYKIFDGMFMVKQISLELPAKQLDVVAVNSKWAKKL